MFSMGYRRAKSTQGNTNFQKKNFFGKQLRDHYPAGLKASLSRCVGVGDEGKFDTPYTFGACTTRVRKTEVRTTPVRSQQCECQQCEGVNSANETRVRMSNVRMPAVRCDIGAKKVRQQCECQQCESHFFFSLILIGFGRNGKREAAETWMRKVTCCPTRTDLFQLTFTFNTVASMFVFM